MAFKFVFVTFLYITDSIIYKSSAIFPDLRVKSENDYHSGYNNSPPPAVPVPTSNYHDKAQETSPVPPKPSPDLWPTKLITSKSGGIATADGKKIHIF